MKQTTVEKQHIACMQFGDDLLFEQRLRSREVSAQKLRGIELIRRKFHAMRAWQ